MSDKDFFENNETLKFINSGGKETSDELYNRLLSKPLLTGNDLLALPCEPNDYLVENFLWRDDVAFIIGKEKACKSIFTTQEAMAMTNGKVFLGMFDVVKELKVLYVQAEGSIGETKDRIKSSLKHERIEWKADNWRHYYPSALSLDTEEGYVEFKKRIVESEFLPDVIILDPLYMSVDGDLIDNKSMRRFFRNIRRLKEDYRCSFIIVHHERRPKTDTFGHKVYEGDNAIFGSSMFKNFASHVLRISITNEKGHEIFEDKEGQPIYRKVVCSTQRSGNVNKRVLLQLFEKPLVFEMCEAKCTAPSEKNVLNYLRSNKPASIKQLEDNLGIISGTIRSALGRLKEKGLAKTSHKDEDGKTVFWEAIKE